MCLLFTLCWCVFASTRSVVQRVTKRRCWSFFFLLSLFVYLEREYSQEGQKGRERIPRRLRTVSAEPDLGLELTNCEIMA